MKSPGLPAKASVVRGYFRVFSACRRNGRNPADCWPWGWETGQEPPVKGAESMGQTWAFQVGISQGAEDACKYSLCTIWQLVFKT